MLQPCLGAKPSSSLCEGMILRKGFMMHVYIGKPKYKINHYVGHIRRWSLQVLPR